METFQVRKIRNLAFKNVGQGYLTCREHIFINIQDDALQNSIDTLSHGISDHSYPGRAKLNILQRTTMPKENMSEGLLIRPSA